MIQPVEVGQKLAQDRFQFLGPSLEDKTLAALVTLRIKPFHVQSIDSHGAAGITQRGLTELYKAGWIKSKPRAKGATAIRELLTTPEPPEKPAKHPPNFKA